MLDRCKCWLYQAFTGKDNKTIDIGRVLWAIGVLVFLSLSVYDTIRGSSFDAQTWGIGFGATLAAGGAAIAMKANTEPSSEDK